MLEKIKTEINKKAQAREILKAWLYTLASGLKKVVQDEIVTATVSQLYDQSLKNDLEAVVFDVVRERIEKHPDYSYLAGRIAFNALYKNIINVTACDDKLETAYKENFASYIQKGIEQKILDPMLAQFDLELLAKALVVDRDKRFMYMGAQILIDRYLLRDRSEMPVIFELPQWFWMRIAMGLAIKEKEQKEKYAISFYNALSNMDLVSSTPTLFNSGTIHSQMSSCYLNTVHDSLEGIFKTISDNARLSKWAGGIGTDWTNVRATGSKINGTNGFSQGVIPFIKVFNDVALAVNQGGKRKGAMCAYMEIWHLDFEQFLELRKNTGDERRRAHDINTASWIPDLFMKRVEKGENWTFFCPADVPDLHGLFGKAFEERYCYYESLQLKRARTIRAESLWKKMLTMLYETGHPWLTFKDPINIRNTQDHVGVIYSSNLCTEITLNSSEEETAVCNLASINLANMISESDLDEEKLAKTVEIGIRMLDNVIDNNFYPIPEVANANFRHRAVGLGLMGYQDALFKLDISFASEENLEFADRSMEMISYYAILASSHLAKERGCYQTFKGSKWDRSLFPLDTIACLEKERGQKIDINRTTRLDWDKVRRSIKENGMRNSNVMAIAPTATISNIAGVFPSIEPVFKNIYMKENMSGNFLVINHFLIADLEKQGLWNDSMLSKIKENNGSVQGIEEIPLAIQGKYKEAFEIDSYWMIKAAALRGKWIDQSASTNLFMKTKSGKEISKLYTLAWKSGLKTMYYFRSLGASQASKFTTSSACLISDQGCEACQ